MAQSALQGAQAELTAAKAADQEAQTELDASVLAEQRATRDLAAVESRIGVSQQDLGRLARSAYQSSGSMGEWAIVLSSTTPNQLADRLSFLQSVGSAGNAMLSRLEQDRADLVNAQASLSAARRRQEDAQGGRGDRRRGRPGQDGDGAVGSPAGHPAGAGARRTRSTTPRRRR